MPKSSATYSTVLAPDPRLRAAVFIVAAAAFGGGLLLIGTLPLAPGWRVACGAAWLAAGGLRLGRLIRGFRRADRLTLAADGALTVTAAGRPPAAARLLPGSIVLGSLAWLRIGFEDGTEGVELLAGDTRESDAWRRLQVIWRHLGTGA